MKHLIYILTYTVVLKKCWPDVIGQASRYLYPLEYILLVLRNFREKKKMHHHGPIRNWLEGEL
jgi:hypothetical protein